MEVGLHCPLVNVSINKVLEQFQENNNSFLFLSGKYCVTAPDAKTGFTNNFVPNSPNYYVVDMVQVTYTCTSPNAKFVTNENLNWINVPCRTADTWEYSDPWPECVEFTVCTETPPAPEAGMHNDYNPSNEIRNDHWIRLVKKGYLS